MNEVAGWRKDNPTFVLDHPLSWACCLGTSSELGDDAIGITVDSLAYLVELLCQL